MAEKLLEDIVTELNEKTSTQNFNSIILNKLKSSNNHSIEEFAQFYLSLVKSQTDEFIKNSSSACSTPLKIVNATTETTVNSISVNEKISDSSDKGDVKNSKRIISRELFSNQERKPARRAVLNSTPLGANESPRFGEGFQSTSTPTSFSRINRSNDEQTPTNTSTPNSFFNTRNSSFDQSSSTQRNFSKKSNDTSKNNSTNRRNTSSPLCLADFINASSSSSTGKGGNKKKHNQSTNLQSHGSKQKLSNLDFPSLESNSNVQKDSSVEAKPKKRVMPITVSKKVSTETPKFTSSSFQTENNLVNLITLEEIESNIFKEREMLRECRNEISKDFNTEQIPMRDLHTLIRENFQASPSQLGFPSTPKSAYKPSIEYDETKIEQKEILIAMAQIYSFILNINFVPNILSEISYLINLINTEYNPYEHQTQNTHKLFIDIAANILKKFHNVIFFATCVLGNQKETLAMLDSTTIRVLCDYERIQNVIPNLFEYLKCIIQKKVQLDALTTYKEKNSTTNEISNIVFFQQETDNRDNFPSDREFGAFKKQRDAFYTILRTWDLKHLDPSWDFRKELGMKIRSLLTLLEHPINMAHLAKLFTAQLIISCNFDDELQSALPNIDSNKLSKLRQRLIAPSQFSTQYLFPGNQAFFRDFVICCDFHLMFMEQLKLSLINELLQMNDSTMETFTITHDNEVEIKENNFQQEFIVRAETISTMRVIGKFIGFVVSRSFNYEGYRNTLVDQKQLNLRNMIHPEFDVKSVIVKAIDSHKLLGTIPWLVEYLSMLDFITIRLDYYKDLFKLLYSIYTRSNAIDNNDGFCLMLQSKFIIRTCLGWLYDHPNIPEEYYNFNSPINFDSIKMSITPINIELNAQLETIIHAACPFLADFRVSVMPQRITKAVSRTGRYRHITTKIQNKDDSVSKTQNYHERLIDAFLASQSLSVRKVVDFTIDRATSAVIKDFQVKYLLNVRKETKSVVENLVHTIKSLEALKAKMREIFHQKLDHLVKEWNEEVGKNSKNRIEAAFDALLPIETLTDVKRTLINITLEKTLGKLESWRRANITIDFFSKDIHVDAMKLLESYPQTISTKRTAQNMILNVLVENQPSDYFQILQTFLHYASYMPEKLELDEIMRLFDATEKILNEQTLPSSAYRNIAFYLLQLVLLIIANKCDFIAREFVEKVFNIWQHKCLVPFTSLQMEEELIIEQHVTFNVARIKIKAFIFNHIMSPSFMIMMHGKGRNNFKVFGDFLVELMKNKFISLENLNEQFVGLFKFEWSKEILDSMHFILNYVKDALPKESHSESLFMEFVADLAKEMQDF